MCQFLPILGALAEAPKASRMLSKLSTPEPHSTLYGTEQTSPAEDQEASCGETQNPLLSNESPSSEGPSRPPRGRTLAIVIALIFSMSIMQ